MPAFARVAEADLAVIARHLQSDYRFIRVPPGGIHGR